MRWNRRSRAEIALRAQRVEALAGALRTSPASHTSRFLSSCFLAAQSPRARVASTHTAGGSRSSVSMRGFSKPASESRAANLSAAAADVAAVAPGQRGCETRAIRPPGRSRRPMSRSRAVGSGQMPTVDRQCGVERPVGHLQALDRRVDDADPSGPDGGRVAPASLPDHHLRVVDTDHQPPQWRGCVYTAAHDRAASNRCPARRVPGTWGRSSFDRRALRLRAHTAISARCRPASGRQE